VIPSAQHRSPLSTLSGGFKLPVLIARVLASEPDLLLLDEPTNHLDAETVAWLEHHLQHYAGTVIAVTHDRYFLDNVAGWILELDRGHGIPWEGNYSSWLEQKEQRLEIEEKQENARIKAMKAELEWVRSNPKGRHAKSKARLSRYEELATQDFQRRNETQELFIPPGPRLGDLVIEAQGLKKSFGDKLLFEELDFKLPPGGIVGIIGPNGAGKTTLFRMLVGHEQPDAGTLRIGETVKIAYVDQSRDSLSAEKTVWEEISDGQDIISVGRHELNSRTYVSRFNFTGTDQQKRVGSLSGGERNRVHLAKLLQSGGNLLLLDEPTNHLDIATIRWLEDRVYSYPGAVLFITHDRAFLRRLATRIVELDRGRLTDWPGDYDNYLRRRDERLNAEEKEHARFDKKLSQEEAWIRQGIKARRTRNEGRVRALEAMREVRAERVARPGDPRIRIGEADPSGRKVIQAHRIVYGYGDEPLIDGLTIRIQRGDRIGLVGNNGVGKSTLLKLLLGELAPESGTVKHGTNLEIGYFDQLRETLDEEKSVADNVGDGRTYIRLNGKDRHVIGYLKGFLFSPKRAMTKVKALSGGERNRIILAKLFTRPANLLVLDEPTNDLDVNTLRALEEALEHFGGCAVVISHDRWFLDRIATHILAFEGNSEVVWFEGNYSDYEKDRKQRLGAEADQPHRIKYRQLTRD